jgi:hypothetical protein
VPRSKTVTRRTVTRTDIMPATCIVGASNNRVFDEEIREQARGRGWQISPYLSSSEGAPASERARRIFSVQIAR